MYGRQAARAFCAGARNAFLIHHQIGNKLKDARVQIGKWIREADAPIRQSNITFQTPRNDSPTLPAMTSTESRHQPQQKGAKNKNALQFLQSTIYHIEIKHELFSNLKIFVYLLKY
ncbi:MAG: hypothetical protein JHC88_07015 [Niveispirillum sp.]|nr:hypothetical protein [Niveispirillum sp.]